MHFYLVGGAVRDGLLHKPCQDRDFVVVGGTEEKMARLGFKKVGKSFPVFLHPKTGEEYALCRREKKTGEGHRGFTFDFAQDITLEEDALRRDFTCNALYQEPYSGRIIDFYHGREDINNHILRHISEHFAEDPLRVLRMCRFAAQLNFAIAPETMTLSRKMVTEGALRQLSRQRIWGEVAKALSCADFYKFIQAARECGALQEIFPEIAKLWSVSERADYHPEGNSGAHTMLALQAAHTTDALVNFAVLVHDAGKGATNPQKWPSHRGHDILGEKIVADMARRLQIPSVYASFARFCALHHMVSHRPLSEEKKKVALIAVELLRGHKVGYAEKFIAVMAADINGRGKTADEKEQCNLKEVASALRTLCRAGEDFHFDDSQEFPAALAELKAHKITSDEFHERLAEMLWKRTFGQELSEENEKSSVSKLI